ncbi:SIS domain-containing protein, partial [Vibrio parahaemolyticus]
EALAGARRIICVGFGGSGPVALDAGHKLFRLDVPIQSAADEPRARMAAAGLKTGDALLVISNTGRTVAAVEIARLAREGGATVIALTAP